MARRALKPTDLVEAAKRGDCEAAVEVLKVYPTQVNVEFSGRTALQEAASRGLTDMMIILLRNKADLYSYDIEYSTALHYAVRGNKPEAVLLLLKSDTMRKLIIEKDGTGITAPELAFNLKHRECVRAFVEWDNDVQLKQKTPRRFNFVPQEETYMETENVNEMAPQKEVTPKAEPEILESCEDKCYFCKKNAAAITFEPCQCKLSCFECSLSVVACACGEPIEKRCYNESPQLTKLIEEVKQNRRLVQELMNQNAVLRGYTTCSICEDLPIMCTLMDCGHVYCIPCIKKIKKQNGASNAQCPECRRASRYVVLHAKWPR